MRIGPLAHGVLLVVALLFAYQTWTRDQSKERKLGDYVVWDKGDKPVQRAVLESPDQTVTIERNSSGDTSYAWVKIATTKKITPPEPVVPTEGGEPAEEAQANAVEASETEVKEFPASEDGMQLLSDLAKLPAIAKTGPLTDEKRQEYELTDSKTNLVVFFSDNSQKTLAIGKRVFRGSDQYVADTETDIGYVVSAEIMNKLSRAENDLALKKLHDFETDDIHSVSVKTAKGERKLVKSEVNKDGKTRSEWSYSDANGPDVALRNFIDQLQQLRPPVEYDPELKMESLTHIASFRFYGENKGDIGFLELYRRLPGPHSDKTDPEDNKTEYWVKSALTLRPGRVTRHSAERLDQNLVERFGIEPGPDTPDTSDKPDTPEKPNPTPQTPPTEQPNAHGQDNPHAAPGSTKPLPAGKKEQPGSAAAKPANKKAAGKPSDKPAAGPMTPRSKPATPAPDEKK